MTTLRIQAEADILLALEQTAQRQTTTIDHVVEDALRQYLRLPPPPPKTYSFIGIGHSGKGNLAAETETILEQALNRREGWSLPQ